jgi:hypothetical protein
MLLVLSRGEHLKRLRREGSVDSKGKSIWSRAASGSSTGLYNGGLEDLSAKRVHWRSI